MPIQYIHYTYDEIERLESIFVFNLGGTEGLEPSTQRKIFKGLLWLLCKIARDEYFFFLIYYIDNYHIYHSRPVGPTGGGEGGIENKEYFMFRPDIITVLYSLYFSTAYTGGLGLYYLFTVLKCDLPPLRPHHALTVF